MTTLTFPDTEGCEAAFNSALSQGVFTDDEKQTTFWAHYELLGTVTADDGSVVDVFRQTHTLAYVRIPRSTEGTE